MSVAIARLHYDDQVTLTATLDLTLTLTCPSLHYGDQVKLDKRQDHLENARSQPAAQAKGQAELPTSDRCVPLP